jgi:hypothetical protein
MKYLTARYGYGFHIEPPENTGDGWIAKPLSGNHRLIEATTAGELECMIRLIIG